MQAPYLILCSENDDLAPYEVICNFARRVQDLGGDIKLVKWSDSPHVGLLLNLIIHVNIYHLTCIEHCRNYPSCIVTRDDNTCLRVVFGSCLGISIRLYRLNLT